MNRPRSALAADANAAPAATAALATTASTAPVVRRLGRHRHLLPRLRSGGRISLSAPGPGECMRRARREGRRIPESGLLALLECRRHLERRRPHHRLQMPTAATTRPTTAGCTTSARTSKPTWIMSDSSTNWTRTIYPGFQLQRQQYGSGQQRAQSARTIQRHLFTDNNLRPGQDLCDSRAGVQGQLQGQHHRQPEMARERLRHRQGRRPPGERVPHCSAAGVAMDRHLPQSSRTPRTSRSRTTPT